MVRNKIDKCCKLLSDNRLSVAFAESATVGKLCEVFGSHKNAGNYFKGGIICYDAMLKEGLLKVSSTLIKKHTPESAEVTRAITTGLAEVIEANLCIGVTGLTAAGGSETKAKPVGTMFFCGLLEKKIIFEDQQVFHGSSAEIISKSVGYLADRIYNYLMGR